MSGWKRYGPDYPSPNWRHCNITGGAYAYRIFVNSIEIEGPTFATGLLAMAALNRGHEVVYLTPGDFTLRSDDSLTVHATVLPKAKYKKADAFTRHFRTKHWNGVPWM